MFQIPALDTLPTPEARLDFLNTQLRIIAVSAAQAQARGDQADLDRLLDLYRKARQDAATLRGEVSAAEQPGAFLLALSRFSDEATQVGVDAFGVVNAYAHVLPLLLVGLLVVVGIGFQRGTLKLGS